VFLQPSAAVGRHQPNDGVVYAICIAWFNYKTPLCWSGKTRTQSELIPLQTVRYRN